MPSLAFALLVVLGLVTPGAEARSDACATLFVPPQSGLVCRPVVGDGDGARASVEPTDGPFAEFSRMTLRELDRERDALAWRRPEHWLRSQMEIDLGDYVAVLERFARDPDNPFGGQAARSVLQGLATALDRLGRLALAACRDPRRVPSGHYVLRCRFGREPLALHMQVRLVAAGERRWAINIRSLSARRLRHLEAVANSFRPVS